MRLLLAVHRVPPDSSLCPVVVFVTHLPSIGQHHWILHHELPKTYENFVASNEPLIVPRRSTYSRPACCMSKDADRVDVFAACDRCGQMERAAGCRGILVYTDNSIVDPG